MSRTETERQREGRRGKRERDRERDTDREKERRKKEIKRERDEERGTQRERDPVPTCSQPFHPLTPPRDGHGRLHEPHVALPIPSLREHPLDAALHAFSYLRRCLKRRRQATDRTPPPKAEDIDHIGGGRSELRIG